MPLIARWRRRRQKGRLWDDAVAGCVVLWPCAEFTATQHLGLSRVEDGLGGGRWCTQRWNACYACVNKSLWKGGAGWPTRCQGPAAHQGQEGWVVAAPVAGPWLPPPSASSSTPCVLCVYCISRAPAQELLFRTHARRFASVCTSLWQLGPGWRAPCPSLLFCGSVTACCCWLSAA